MTQGLVDDARNSFDLCRHLLCCTDTVGHREMVLRNIRWKCRCRFNDTDNVSENERSDEKEYYTIKLKGESLFFSSRNLT